MNLKMILFPPLLLKLQKEPSKKNLFLDDFNIYLLKKLSDSIDNFIDTFRSNVLLPHIFLPTRISKPSKLIDSIFSNSTSLEEIESGNVTSTFSDRLPLFTFLIRFSLKNTSSKM